MFHVGQQHVDMISNEKCQSQGSVDITGENNQGSDSRQNKRTKMEKSKQNNTA
jgi:hypothetical protein